MSQLSFEELLKKYINQSCSPAEVDQLFELFEKGEAGAADNELLKQHFQRGLQPTGYTNDAMRQRLQSRFDLIKQKIAPEPITKQRSLVVHWAAAAAIIVLAGCGIWYYFLTEKHATPALHQEVEVQPGSDKAVLTLADGKTIPLDSSTQGIIGRQGQTAIDQRGGQLIYEASKTSSGEAIYNTLSTPRGAQYQLTLPDASKVWLNAASSIRFPAAFNDSARVVYITGEVYFEVSKQTDRTGKRIPFDVIIPPRPVGPGGVIKVLGTHLNVNAYEDEETIRTTLLEGKVRIHQSVTDARPSVVLKPGEQAVWVTDSIPLTIDHSPNLEQVMAWKNGLFRFDGVGLSTVMRQLARWYDVEVLYAPGAPVMELFNGAIQRNLQLSQVLTGMNAMGIHVERQGKKLIVMP